MTENARQHIVVGVDGGDDSDRAVRYAVKEARRTGRPVRLVHVMPETVPMTPMLPLFAADTLRAVGSHLLADAAARVHDLGNGTVDVETVLAHGPRTAALLAHADDAAMIVLGRRSSTLARLRTGSTTSAVASRAECPVVAVPENWEYPQERYHVVAAIDGTPGSADVLRAGLAAAQEREERLVVLHAWRPMAPYEAAFGHGRAAEIWQRQTEPAVWQQVAGLRADYPGVEVEVDLRYEHTADALVEAARHADLLVMGRRGEHHGLALGSKARALLRAGDCPVEIVPVRQPRVAEVPRQAEARDVSAPARRTD